MNLSYKILSVLGIDIELHLFFILFILAFLLLSPMLALLLILIFFFVTLHELAHSIVAIRNKIKVRKIILLPIGGMAMVESTDIKPITEIKMSLAGPLLNIIFVYVCIVIAYVFSVPLGTWLVQFFDPTQTFNLPLPELILFYSFYANLILGVFNLFLPAFPLDGGRILRALLALKMDYIKASRIAKNISLVLAGILFMVSFLYGEIWIMIISFFIAFGAVAEFNSMIVHKTLVNIKIRDVLSKNYLVLASQETMATALKKMLAKKSMGALVKTKDGLKLITLMDISKVPKTSWKNKVGSVAKPVGRVQVAAGIESALAVMEREQVPIVPVFNRNILVGVIDRVDIERVLKIAEALGKTS